MLFIFMACCRFCGTMSDSPTLGQIGEKLPQVVGGPRLAGDMGQKGDRVVTQSSTHSTEDALKAMFDQASP